MTCPPGRTARSAARKNRALPFCLPLEVFRPQPMPNLRIATQCTGAAARHIRQHHVVRRIVFERGGICEPALHSIAERLNPLPQLGKSLRVRLVSHNPRFGFRSARISVFPPGAAQQSRIAPPRGASSATSCDPSS